MKQINSEPDTSEGDSRPEPLRTQGTATGWVVESANASTPADAQRDPAQSPDQPSQVSLVGESMVIKGELQAAEDLEIAGRLEGSIMHTANRLVVRRTGVVKADIATNNLIIEGRVEGDVHGRQSVVLSETAIVSGNIETARLSIADGAQFNGRITMETDTSINTVGTS